jgi:hypothetical protein
VKHILVFSLLFLFAWVAFVPLEGMSKFPLVNVKFNYAQGTGEAHIAIEGMAMQKGSTPEELH